MSDWQDQKDADYMLDEWGSERARIQGGGYPTGNTGEGGQDHSDRTFATVSRLNHLIAVDNAVTALPIDHQKALEAQYVWRMTERKAAEKAGLSTSTWQRMRDQARLGFMYKYRLGLWQRGKLDKAPDATEKVRDLVI